METMEIGEQALEGGWKVKWSYCEDVESPRTECNLGHLVTWHPRYRSPDENPYRDPDEFRADMLVDLLTHDEMLDAVRSGMFATLRLDADGQLSELCRAIGTGKETWEPVEGYNEWRDAEELAEALSQRSECDRLLRTKMALKTVYMLDHSGVAYGTGDFGDPWDSGAVGFAYATEDEASSWFGGIPTSWEEVEGILDEEVRRYSEWANGETYRVELVHDGQTVDRACGCIGDADLEAGIAEMRRQAPSAA